MRRRLFVSTLAWLVVLAACGGVDVTTAPSGSVVGTWTLRTINGSPLPYVFSQTSTTKVEVVSDTIALSAIGGFTETTAVRSTVNGTATTAQSVAGVGAYTVKGTAVTLLTNDGLTGNMTWSGSTLSAADAGGAIYVYMR